MEREVGLVHIRGVTADWLDHGSVEISEGSEIGCVGGHRMVGSSRNSESTGQTDGRAVIYQKGSKSSTVSRALVIAAG